MHVHELYAVVAEGEDSIVDAINHSTLRFGMVLQEWHEAKKEIKELRAAQPCEHNVPRK